MKKANEFYKLRCIMESIDQNNRSCPPPPTSCEMGIEMLSFTILGNHWNHPKAITQNQKTTMQVYDIIDKFERLEDRLVSYKWAIIDLCGVTIFLLTLIFFKVL